MSTVSIISYLKKDKAIQKILKDKFASEGYIMAETSDIVFVIGGDGSCLSAIRKQLAHNPLIVMLNTGSLGYFTEFDHTEIDRVFHYLKRKEYVVDSIPIYQAKVVLKNKEKHYQFVNDFSIEKKGAGAIEIDVHLNDRSCCEIAGNGVLISTAFGSTAYNYGCAGPVVTDIECMLLSSIIPMNNKKYNSLERTLAVGDGNRFTLFPNAKKIRPFHMVCDNNYIELQDVRYVEVSKTKQSIKVMRSLKYNRMDHIRHKILGYE